MKKPHGFPLRAGEAERLEIKRKRCSRAAAQNEWLDSEDLCETMTTVTLGDKSFTVDLLGFLVDYAQWSEESAEGMAPTVGIHGKLTSPQRYNGRLRCDRRLRCPPSLGHHRREGQGAANLEWCQERSVGHELNSS